MPRTRVRFVESPTFPQLETQVNAALAELEADPNVVGIESITYHPGVMGAGAMVSVMIVYRLDAPALAEAEAVAEADAILQEDQG